MRSYRRTERERALSEKENKKEMWSQKGKFEKKANDGERHREAKFEEEIIVYFEGKNGPSNVPKSHVEFPLLYFIIIFKNDLLLDYCYAF